MDVDIKAVHAGTIPWTPEGLAETMRFRFDLEKTPHDDWNRKPKKFSVRYSEDEVEHYSFNVDHPGNQVMDFIMKRHAGDSQTVRMSHGNRWFVVSGFMGRYWERLVKDGLLVLAEGDDDTTADELARDPLIRVLATARYDNTFMNKGQRDHTFSYETIRKKVRVLQDDDRRGK